VGDPLTVHDPKPGTGLLFGLLLLETVLYNRTPSRDVKPGCIGRKSLSLSLSLSLSHGAPPEGRGGSGRGRSWLRPELPTVPAQVSPASSTKWAPTAAAPLSAWAESDEALEAMATARRRTTATRAAGGWRPGLMKW